MNFSKRPLWIAATALLFLTVALYLGRWWPDRRAVPLTVGQPSEQRQRIDRSIEQISDLSIQQAISSLSEYNETYELAQLSSLSPASFGLLYLNQIRGDRRVGMIWQYLAALPAEQAAGIAESMADRTIAEYHDHYLRLIRDPQLRDRHTQTRRHAASAALFFCSFFCAPQVLDEKLEEWDRLMSSDEFSLDFGLLGDYRSSLVRYDPLFGANLLVISGARQGRLIPELNGQLTRWDPHLDPGYESNFKVETGRLFKPGAKTVDTDFTVFTQGATFDPADVIMSFPAFLNPNCQTTLSNGYDSPQHSESLYKLIRQWRDGG